MARKARTRIAPAYDQEEIFQLFDALPKERLEVNNDDALRIAQAVIALAVEDLYAACQSFDLPDTLQTEPERNQWLRQARSRARRIEAFREDAERFLWSGWFDTICEVMDADPDTIRDRIYERAPRD